MGRKLVQALCAILHQAKDNIAWITKPSPKCSGFMAMVQHDLVVRLAAHFAALRLWPDLSQFNAIPETVFYFLVATGKLCLPARVVFPMLCGARKRAFCTLAVTDQPWSRMSVATWFAR